MREPYYTDDLVTLWHGDCREVTTWLEADVLITDPPYGIAWRQGDVKRSDSRRFQRKNATERIANDQDTGARDDVLGLWGDRRAVVFGSLSLPPPSGTRLTCVYHKTDAAAGLRGAVGGVRRDAEAIYLVGKWPSGIGGRSSVFASRQRLTSSTGAVVAAGGHPHTKPNEVMEELILLTDGMIADPFAGGGSTLVAAKNLGRRAVGVELEERFCEVAAKRLAQDTLFGGAA